MKQPVIHCPQCTWRPKAESRWMCVPRCGVEWNTFWTGGVCPGCAHHWEKTQCLDCGVISPHKNWYHYPADEEQREEQRETERTPETADA